MAHPEELAQRRVVWFARFALDIFLGSSSAPELPHPCKARPYQVFGKPEAERSQHATQRFWRIPNTVPLSDLCNDEVYGAVYLMNVSGLSK